MKETLPICNGKSIKIDKIGYEKYRLFQVTKFISVFPTFRRIQQLLQRARCYMENLRSVPKLTVL